MSSSVLDVGPDTGLRDEDEDWEWPTHFSPAGWTPNEDWEEMPLFLKDAPENVQENPDMVALQELVYDGTPDEVAARLKNNGNLWLTEGKHLPESLRNARGFYLQALEQKMEDMELRATILCNLSLVQLKLKNYGKAVADAREALRLSMVPNIKAHYRAALGLQAVGYFSDAMSHVQQGLEIDATNGPLLQLREALEQNLQQVQDIKRKEEEKRQQELEEKSLTESILASKGVKSKPSALSSDHWGLISDHLEPPFLHAETNELVVGCLFMHDEYQRTEVYPHLCELDTLGFVMDQMFPPGAPPVGWDVRGRCVHGNLMVFFTDDENGVWYQVPLECTVQEMYAHPKFFLEGTVAVLHVVPKGSELLKRVRVNTSLQPSSVPK